ncbi:MAG TPA: PDDEXK nuclease domain-containing protein [Gemmataceae bacterium]|nr:PDDEXK nuclease domain-containing protein [Gemmataceae bacterium]
MNKPPKKSKRQALVKSAASAASPADFDEVIALIESARTRAFAAVNQEVIDLYWNIGATISRRVMDDGWGQGTIQALSDHIQRRHPGIRGFSASNLWRMRQFHDTYRNESKLAPLLRELNWTHNLMIMSRCKQMEERAFYLQICQRKRWSTRDLERQLATALFERSLLSPPKLAAVLRELHLQAGQVFKDTYLLDFLDLPAGHSEADLHNGLIEQLKHFLIELGRDFCFVGRHYTLQVGGRDFIVDLLFFNRALNCLVAFELKIDEFQPEHLGKLEFYLEALDRDVRKPHEQPSIGVLLCATKDNEVVEYALSRALSPALVAEYQTRLPDKKLLEAKLHEFYELAQARLATSEIDNS